MVGIGEAPRTCQITLTVMTNSRRRRGSQHRTQPDSMWRTLTERLCRRHVQDPEDMHSMDPLLPLRMDSWLSAVSKHFGHVSVANIDDDTV